MNKKKVILGLILFVFGVIGVASMLTMHIPIPEETVALLKDSFTPEQMQMLALINPTFLVLVAVVIGTILYQKVGFKLPVLERIVGIDNPGDSVKSVAIYGIVGGVLAGVALTVIGLIFTPILPAEFTELNKSIQPSLAARFLYGGITEEIMMRFGLMTLIVWLGVKIFKGQKPMVYWIGIFASALLFAFGHFPIAYQAVGEPSTGLLSYILIGNSVGGIAFGWLYWKKGLESAFLAHIFTHVVMVLAEML